MIKRDAENERVKSRYLVYLKGAKGRDNENPEIKQEWLRLMKRCAVEAMRDILGVGASAHVEVVDVPQGPRQ